MKHFDRLKRREFITALGGAAAWPLAVRAQLPAPVGHRTGLLSPLSATAATRNVAAFRSALRDLGYVEGRNMTLVSRFGDGALERMVPLAHELVALKPDVLVTGSQAGAMAAFEGTRTIPIVTLTPEDPVASGLAKSLAGPGGNVTGTWLLGDDALVGKRLDFLKLALPAFTRIGAIVNSGDPTDRLQISRFPDAARALGITVKLFDISSLARLDALAGEIAHAGVEALYVGHGPLLNSARTQVTAMVAHLKLPAVYGFREFADAGGLVSYGPNLPDMYRQSARLVHRILRGANPGDLPFELPTRYELVVNLKTAKAMGLTISESFLLLADEVIE
jgi:putative ABC transport system substrate-binding protein